MPFYIRVPSLITPVHCITQTEEPNIIRRNSDKKAVLVDFGASRVVTPLNRSVTGTVIGSAEYIAPEQANGKANNPSDLYSLGVTCIYLLTQI